MTTVDQLKERDVAQLGSLVLGTKCHWFQSSHSDLLLLLWAVTRDSLRSIQIGHTKSFILQALSHGYKNHPFLYSLIYLNKKRS